MLSPEDMIEPKVVADTMHDDEAGVEGLGVLRRFRDELRGLPDPAGRCVVRVD